MRIGQGYDSHRFIEGKGFILGGVPIPFEKGLKAHSDGDVLVHAIIDALLGAAHLGDIGRLYPDKDPKYEGISSILLLKDVKERVNRAGFEIENLDATVICENPKLAPYISSIESSLAKALELEICRVSVKAKTNEKMGFTGNGEGMAVMAVALIKENNQ